MSMFKIKNSPILKKVCLFSVFFCLGFSTVWADYYTKLRIYDKVDFQLNQGSLPYSFNLSYQTGNLLKENVITQTKSDNYRKFSELIDKVSEEKEFYLFFYDERFRLRKIEKRVVNGQKEDLLLTIKLDRNERLLYLEEKNPATLKYRIIFDKNQRQAKNSVVDKTGKNYAHHFSYANNERTVDFFYGKTWVSRTVEKNQDMREHYVLSSGKNKKTAMLSFYDVKRRSSTEKDRSELIERYSQNDKLLERLEHLYVDDFIRKTVSSKGYEVTYDYDTNDRMTNKIVVDTETGKIKEEFFFQYQPINEHFNFIFIDLFRFNAISQGALISEKKPIFFEEQQANYTGELIGTKRITFYGDGHLRIEKKLVGERIFQMFIEKSRLKNLVVRQSDGKLLYRFTYNYDEQGRVIEEQQHLALHSNLWSRKRVFGIRYVYSNEEEPASNEQPSETNVEILGKKPNPIALNAARKLEENAKLIEFLGKSPENFEQPRLANINETLEKLGETINAEKLEKSKKEEDTTIDLSAFHRIGLFYLGRSLYHYLQKREIKPPSLLELAKRVKGEESEKAPVDLYGNDLERARSKLQKLINSELRKVLFLNSYGEVIGYVRIDHKKPEKNKNQLTFEYYGEEPLFFFSEKRQSKWFVDRRNIIVDELAKELIGDEGGRYDFLNKSKDSINLFTQEKLLESYYFEFLDGRLPSKAEYTKYNSTESRGREKSIVALSALPYQTQDDEQTSDNLQEIVESTVVNIPFRIEQEEDLALIRSGLENLSEQTDAENTQPTSLKQSEQSTQPEQLAPPSQTTPSEQPAALPSTNPAQQDRQPVQQPR